MVWSADRLARKLACGVFIAAVACGGNGVDALDAGLDAQLACNPIAQTGCMTSEKCTWIVDIDATASADEIGHIGCVANGALSAGTSCDEAVAAVRAGADTCASGSFCISGKCKPICDPQLVDGAAPGACPTGFACSKYAGVFVSTGEPVAGVCEPVCDPLTQRILGAGTEACGSPEAGRPSRACEPSSEYRSFHCAPTDASFYANTDRVAPRTDFHSHVYGSGCAPGFIPFSFQDADAGVMTTLCAGTCAPLKVDMTIAADVAHADDNRGDKTALGKLVGDLAPVAGHATCDAGVKGSAVSSPHGEDCRYLWFPLAKGDPTKALPSPYNDSLGICFAFEKYLTVTIPGMAQKFPQKSCAELMAAPPSTDPFGSARDNGCYPLTDSLGGSKRMRSASDFRLAHGEGAAVRHVFD
jgi:hypothetical protein